MGLCHSVCPAPTRRCLHDSPRDGPLPDSAPTVPVHALPSGALAEGGPRRHRGVQPAVCSSERRWPRLGSNGAVPAHSQGCPPPRPQCAPEAAHWLLLRSGHAKAEVRVAPSSPRAVRLAVTRTGGLSARVLATLTETSGAPLCDRASACPPPPPRRLCPRCPFPLRCLLTSLSLLMKGAG